MESLFDIEKRGFRLDSFELYNWGTFHNYIVKLDLKGENALLTGEIGSGKSTIIDALTTLFLPPSKIVYNKAAGASSKERTLYSYVTGEYSLESDIDLGILRPKRLRDHTNYSLLLARFQHQGLLEEFTMALFLYTQPNSKDVKRFYITSTSALSIQEDFLGAKNIRELKKRLKSKAEIFESYKEYFFHFKRVLGIKDMQSLELLYQTVSMKAVGNLTNFIQEHMLEKRSIERSIDALIYGFRELKDAHDAVLEAKEQIEYLEPIQSLQKDLKKIKKRYQTLEKLKRKSYNYFAAKEMHQELSTLQHLTEKRAALEYELKKLAQEILEERQMVQALEIEFEKGGGKRIKDIQKELKYLSKELEQKKRQFLRYEELLRKIDKPSIKTQQEFLSYRQEFSQALEELEANKESLSDKIVFERASIQKYQEELERVDMEVLYLQNNKSNIPSTLSSIRDDIAKSIGIDDEELPFVGELLECKNEEFRGAIESVLRGFALSMLVDEEYYEDVSEYVDRTKLNQKFVYLRVDTYRSYEVVANEKEELLYNQLNIKTNTPFYEYIKFRLIKDFDYVLCEDASSLRQVNKGVTRYGQMKQNFHKHQKDDRHDIFDERNYVLGWDNRLKLQTILQEQKLLQEKLNIINNRIKEYQKKSNSLEKQRDLLRDLLTFESFEDIDIFYLEKRIEQLEQEKRRLSIKDNNLYNTENELKKAKETLLQKELKEKDLTIQLGRINAQEEYLQKRIEDLKKIAQAFHIEEFEEQMQKEFGVAIKEELQQFDKMRIGSLFERSLKELLEAKEERKRRVILAMRDFLEKFPKEKKELDAHLEALDSFILKLHSLKEDNLPKYEQKFRSLFHEGTINHLLKLKEEIYQAQKEITTKIALINQNLQEIEYNQGTYIQIEMKRASDQETGEFLNILDELTVDIFTKEEQIDEEKFEKINALIERLQGRKELSEIDRKWREKISDIRRYYTFLAVERYQKDDTIKEYYTDSSGKSGGQKEKLAYTILASALSYQFGLLDEQVKSRTFRFVMIDEAFGKGSDESARYALNLFKKLDLQLLIVTPKQKIHVIEPFVRSVHFVHNEHGRNSKLFSLSIEEYRELSNEKE